MSILQILLIVFIGIIGFIPDLITGRKKIRSKEEKRNYRVRVIIPILVALALIVNTTIENRKNRKNEKKHIEEKSFSTDANKLMSEIILLMSEIQGDYIFLESSDEIIASANESIEAIQELRSLPGQQDAYKEK